MSFAVSAMAAIVASKLTRCLHAISLLAIANDSDYGLAGSVFTADSSRGLGIAGRVRTGTFGVNQGYTMDPFAPFGGSKPAATDGNSAPKASTATRSSSRSPPQQRGEAALNAARCGF